MPLTEADTCRMYVLPLLQKAGWTDEQIAEHIESGCWRDKAGAYAIKENGDEFVEKIEGSLTNVMGLPMELLQSVLDGLKGFAG